MRFSDAGLFAIDVLADGRVRLALTDPFGMPIGDVAMEADFVADLVAGLADALALRKSAGYPDVVPAHARVRTIPATVETDAVVRDGPVRAGGDADRRGAPDAGTAPRRPAPVQEPGRTAADSLAMRGW
ncbi:MAG: hypothetical protein AB7P02_25225 [Alphaproteobacteria bacterium]